MRRACGEFLNGFVPFDPCSDGLHFTGWHGIYDPGERIWPARHLLEHICFI